MRLFRIHTFILSPSFIIDLLNASEEDLRQLAQACDPATFGMNNQDVLDLSYRTAAAAGKMDANNFMTVIDLERAGLMDALRYDLLDGEKGSRPIYAELYNMNVYIRSGFFFHYTRRSIPIHVGTGSFFKAHKDTPRSTDMFGSLVLVFPAPHEGGALVLCHGGDETAFDSGAMLKDAKKEPSIAYVAFFSDVEHEVLPVTAGHRVTLTYNLYFRELPSQARDPTQRKKIYRTLPPTANTFLVAFQQQVPGRPDVPAQRRRPWFRSESRISGAGGTERPELPQGPPEGGATRS